MKYKTGIVILVLILLMIASIIIIRLSKIKEEKSKCCSRIDCYGNVIKDNKIRFKGCIQNLDYDDNMVIVNSGDYKITLLLDEDSIITNIHNDKLKIEDLNIGDYIEATPKDCVKFIYPKNCECCQINILEEKEE